ncbi:hypothetical protein T4D_10221 [Trichinella pseudospiralis]|uniref:Uncharacterized protein n=1 Tax=Trichinella pseudospiralis TaxID=6337 RepID=A0A0V1G027_TRIPS|nr:hypothetical protein T4D_10221 [Trichinella pseudospiralis]
MKFFIIPLFGHKNGQNNQKRILASEPQHLDQTLFPKLEKYCLHDELSPHQDWAYKLNANLASMKTWLIAHPSGAIHKRFPNNITDSNG